jgi:hypothetical protein
MISQRRDVLAIVVGLLLTVVVALVIVAMVALPNLRQGSQILTPDGQRAVKRARQRAKQKPAAAAGSTWRGLVASKRLVGRLGRRIARLGRAIARGWAPISAALHDLLDQLEARDAAKRNDFGAPETDPAASSATEPAMGSADRGPIGTSIRPVEPIAPADRSAERELPASVVRESNSGPASAPGFESAQEKTPERTPEPAPAPEEKAAPRQTRFDVAKVVGRSSVGRPRSTSPISGPIPEVGGAQRDEQDREPDRTIDLRSSADQGVGSARRAR